MGVTMAVARCMPKPYTWRWWDYVMWMIIILAVVLWPLCRASAATTVQTTVEFKLLPPGHDGQVQGVGRARYYLLKEYLELAQFDSELVFLRYEVSTLRQTEELLSGQLRAQATQIQTLESDKQILNDRSLRLDENWKTCEAALIDCQSGSIWPYVVAISGVVLGVAAGVTIIILGD